MELGKGRRHFVERLTHSSTNFNPEDVQSYDHLGKKQFGDKNKDSLAFNMSPKSASLPYEKRHGQIAYEVGVQADAFKPTSNIWKQD